jgi:hypothetical protein
VPSGTSPVMISVPNPAEVAARFRPRAPVLPQRSPSAPPCGWRDDLTFPLKDRHFYLDTGIFHSLAGVDQDVRRRIVPFIDKHERNETVFREVMTQTAEPLYTLRLEIWKMAQDREREACSLKVDHAAIETIRSELIADSQLRHPHSQHGTASRDRHGGEAQLIHAAELHSPKGALMSNDAGASAVASKHGVFSAHFVHLVRAAVRGGLPVDDALSAARGGLEVSKLAAKEKARTCREAWLTESGEGQ